MNVPAVRNAKMTVALPVAALPGPGFAQGGEGEAS
jgi:hypothetical protein